MPPWSGQPRGRTTRRAVAKATGSSDEKVIPHEADLRGNWSCQGFSTYPMARAAASSAITRFASSFTALVYNLGNFMRTLALPKEVEHWSLTTLREKLVKIGVKVVRHGRYVTFQLAEVAAPGSLFQQILGLINDLRRKPIPA